MLSSLSRQATHRTYQRSVEALSKHSRSEWERSKQELMVTLGLRLTDAKDRTVGGHPAATPFGASTGPADCTFID